MDAEATARRAHPAPCPIDFPSDDGWLAADEVRGLTPETLVARLRLLKPDIAAAAPAAEAQRRPVTEVWEKIRRTGVFYHMVPAEFGGLEFGLQAYIDEMLEIGEACSSTCWVAAFTVEHNFLAALFPPEAQREMFEGGYVIAPGVSNPVGAATRVPGGYRLSGAYKFGSAVMNANWVLAMALVEGSDPPEARWFATPAHTVTVKDTWRMAGMAGTGSNDVEIRDVFISEHRSLSAVEMRTGASPGGRYLKSPLYRMPAIPLLSLATSLPIIAAARAAVDLYRRRLLEGRTTVTSQVRLADKASVQVRLAHADLLARSAEATLRDGAAKLEQLGARGEADKVEDRVRLIAQFAHAARTARDAVNTVVDGSGASAQALANPLQRFQRDVNTATTHVLHDLDSITEQYGRVLLGQEPSTQMF